MESKGFKGVDIPSESEGRALVKFAAYNEIDKHNDVTLKGAFEEGAEFVVSAYNHQSWKGALPVGKGVIKDGGDHVQGDIQFFMNTVAGRETFETVKALGKLQQWSYGYDAEKARPGEHEGQKVRFLMKQVVHEVSPVLLGAGNSTETIDVKSLLDEGASPEDVAYIVSGGVDNDEDTKAAEAEAELKRTFSAEERERLAKEGKAMPDGSFPIVNKNDLANAIQAIGRAKDPAKAKAHIRKRARALGAGDMIPDSWKSGNLRMSDHVQEVVTSVEDLVDRAEEIVKLRKAEGKAGVAEYTSEGLKEIESLIERFKSLATEEVAEDDDVKEIVAEIPVDDALAAVIAASLQNLSEE